MGILNLDDEISLEVKFGGINYKVREANIGEVQAFNKSLLKKGSDEFELTLGLIDKIGIPKEIARTLSAKQFKKLVDFITGKEEEKKS